MPALKKRRGGWAGAQDLDSGGGRGRLRGPP